MAERSETANMALVRGVLDARPLYVQKCEDGCAAARP